jgi:hypothetical protein
MSDELPEGFRPDDATAPDRASTDHTDATFTLKEHGDGTPWVMIEPYQPGLSVLSRSDSFLGLEFRDGVTFAEAQALAGEIRRMLRGISHTRFLT